MESVWVAAKKEATVEPVKAPAAPAPAESKEGADAETYAEGKVWAADSPPGIKSWPQANGIAVGKFGIIVRDVNDLRIRRLDCYIRSLVRHSLLRSGSQIPRLFGLMTHVLNGIHDVGLLIHVCVAKRRCPGKVLIHVGKDRRKFAQSLHAGIPILLVHCGRELRALQVWILLKETLRLNDLRWVGGSGKNLSNQGVRIQSDRRNQLLQLGRRQSRRHRLPLHWRLVLLRRRSSLRLRSSQPYGKDCQCQHDRAHNEAGKKPFGEFHIHGKPPSLCPQTHFQMCLIYLDAEITTCVARVASLKPLRL